MFQKKNNSASFPMECETARLILRVLTPEALRPVADFQWRNRELFEKYEPTLPENFYTASHQQAILKCEFQLALKMETIRYYVFLKDDPTQIIGTVCLHDIRRFSYSHCEIGYKFDMEYQHAGYAREAVACAVSIAFENLNLHRIFARVMPENTSSIRLLEALNFHNEGLERGCIQIQGRWQDHIRYAILNPNLDL